MTLPPALGMRLGRRCSPRVAQPSAPAFDPMRGNVVQAPVRMAASREQTLRRGPVSQPRHLDRVDKAIIEALQENGRESFRRIAARIGVAEATVRAHYARLCDDEILQVTGVTNPLGLGFDAQALVGIKV